MPGSTSPICSNLTLSKLASYGVLPPPELTKLNVTSLYCFDPTSAGASESAVSINGTGYTSGGGFSRHFVRSSSAAWQDSVVSAYLNSGVTTPRASLFNRTGRAVPDVAMYGSLFPIIVGGAAIVEAGTSLSSPLFAAIVSLLNLQVLTAKNATIGFANPLLYAMAASSPQTFTDITGGDNICPENTGLNSCPSTCQGYAATTGWGQLHNAHTIAQDTAADRAHCSAATRISHCLCSLCSHQMSAADGVLVQTL